MYLRYIALGLSRYKEHLLLSSGHCRIAKDFNRRATLLDVNPKHGLLKAEDMFSSVFAI